MLLQKGQLQFSEPVTAFTMMTPDGQRMSWIWSDTIRIEGFDQEVIVIHGALQGHGNLDNIIATPLLFYAYRDGQLVDVTAEVNPDRISSIMTRDIHIADFNNDGRDDIFLSNHGTERYDPFPGEQNNLLIQSEDGSFKDATNLLPQRTDFSHGSSVGDFNHDGHLDIYVNNLGDDEPNPSYFLFNDGQGGFDIPASLNQDVYDQFRSENISLGYLSLAIDIENNNRDDVFLGKLFYLDGSGDAAHGYLRNDENSINLVLDENFIWPESADEIFHYRAIDYNNDGLDDIMIFAVNNDFVNDRGTTDSGRILIHSYENLGSGEFRLSTEDVIDLTPIADIYTKGGLYVDIADITSNGLPDFEVRNWDADWNSIRFTFENNGNGGFHQPLVNYGDIAPPFAQYIDLNGDEVIDLVYADTDYSIAEPVTRIKVQYGFIPDDGQAVPVLPRQRVEDMALLYQAALDRQPDISGLNYFVGNLRQGQSLQDIANSFYLADEFRDQFEQFDNERYIGQLYVNVLGREADPGGVDYWLTDIEDRGRSHADVLVSFAQSQENRDNASEWLTGLAFDPQSDVWLF